MTPLRQHLPLARGVDEVADEGGVLVLAGEGAEGGLGHQLRTDALLLLNLLRGDGRRRGAGLRGPKTKARRGRSRKLILMRTRCVIVSLTMLETETDWEMG